MPIHARGSQRRGSQKRDAERTCGIAHRRQTARFGMRWYGGTATATAEERRRCGKAASTAAIHFTSPYCRVESSQCSVTVVAAVPRRVGGSGPTDRQKAGRSRLRSVFRSGRVFWLPLAGLAALVIGRCGKNSIAEHFLPPARLRWFDGGWKNNHSAVSFGDLDGWLSRKLSCFSFYPRVRRSTLA